jgi:hypothetical protein
MLLIPILLRLRLRQLALLLRLAEPQGAVAALRSQLGLRFQLALLRLQLFAQLLLLEPELLILALLRQLQGTELLRL